MGIPVAGWLSWYLPSTVVSCLQLTRYIPIMIHISMKFFTRIINTKKGGTKMQQHLIWSSNNAATYLAILYIHRIFVQLPTLFSLFSSIPLKQKLANLPSLLYFSPAVIKMNKLIGLLVST